MGMPDLLESIEKGGDDLTVVIKLKKPNAPILANLAMDFATIHSAEYADFLTKKGTPEEFDQIPVGTGSFSLRRLPEGRSHPLQGLRRLGRQAEDRRSGLCHHAGPDRALCQAQGQ